MKNVESIRAALSAPVVIDEKLAQLQQTFAENNERWPDQMEVSDDFGDGRPLPSDIAKRALTRLAAKAAVGESLNELEQLGYYLLQLKARAEYVAPKPVEPPVVISDYTGIVRAKYYSEISADAFLTGMSVDWQPSGEFRVLPKGVSVAMLGTRVLKADRPGPIGALFEISLEIQVRVQCRALEGTVVDFPSIIRGYRLGIRNRRQPIGHMHHMLQDIQPL